MGSDGTSWELPYPSRRQPVLGDDVIATSQPLATQAGMAVFEAGGNAVDAALAAAITLTVVEPTSNGIGGDAFAIVREGGGAVHGLNASGRAPAGLDGERLRARPAMPVRGWDTVTVPGAVSAWTALSERFGRVPFPTLFESAVRHARDGFPVAPLTAASWARAADAYADRADFAAAFLPDGRAPGPGERFRHRDQAATLEAIAATGGETFYRGELAERIAAHAASEGGSLAADDLDRHEPGWVAPLALGYGEATVHELPPNGQGIAALIALALLERRGAHGLPPGTGAAIHLEAEAMKAAFVDVHAVVADPAIMPEEGPGSVADLLDPGRLDDRAAGLDPGRAADAPASPPRPGGTVYLAAADRDGRCVSYIQSNYMGFGSGIVVPGTGIALQNRGAGFVTAAGHPNVVAPGKRPFHTIIPGLVTWPDGTALTFGVMGGPMQPQGHVQVIRRVVDAHENPQAAIDAPRWRVDGGAITALAPGYGDSGGGGRRPSERPGWSLHLEEGADPAAAEELRARGHDVVVEAARSPGFGGAQAVLARRAGHVGASDPRKDGHAAAR